MLDVQGVVDASLAWLASAALAVAGAVGVVPTSRPLPSCWPGQTNAQYRGTEASLGESDTHRWARWYCFPVDPASGLPVKAPYVIGTKDIPLDTLFGRMRVIEDSKARETVYTLMWKAYVLLPPDDPQLVAGVAAMKGN